MRTGLQGRTLLLTPAPRHTATCFRVMHSYSFTHTYSLTQSCIHPHTHTQHTTQERGGLFSSRSSAEASWDTLLLHVYVSCFMCTLAQCWPRHETISHAVLLASGGALAAKNLHHAYLPGKLTGNINSPAEVPCGPETLNTRTIDGSCNYPGVWR